MAKKQNNMDTRTTKPSGLLTIQTIAMPADANPNGDIFGGWVVSQMDLAGSVLAKQTAKGRTATVAIHSMTFRKPVHIGDLVCCYASLQKTGTTSITIDIEVWVIQTHHQTHQYQVTEGTFVYVAIDATGKPRPINTA